MRISDWSSDLCSSDLGAVALAEQEGVHEVGAARDLETARRVRKAAAPQVGRQRLRLLVRVLGTGLLDDVARELRDTTGDPRRSQVERSEEHTSELQSLMRNS